MERALHLAEKGRGRVSPNPMVGAVLVKEGRIIGEGYHACYGGLHAERAALENCAESPEGSTLYVTLEPCCHYGKQPPCTDAILEKGIRRVVIGSGDPNPLVAGKGIGKLKAHGVEVTEGVLQEPCEKLNEIFFHFIKTKTPYVIMKYAMTMDGKLACVSGASQWVTGETARKKVHEDRNRYTAVMVGAGTVLADDPLLTCRLPQERNPVRIICDTHLRTPPHARVVATASQARTIFVSCCTDPARQKPYLEAGCELLTVREKNGHVDLAELMGRLGAQGIDSILLEGGAELHWSALQAGIVKKVQAYIGAKLFGGGKALSPVGGTGVLTPKEAFRLGPPAITVLGEDVLLESEVIPCSRES